MQPPTPSHVKTLARKTDDWFRRARAALLSQVLCHPRCSVCCIGLFPITRLDVRLLQEGLAHLSTDQRTRISGRAAQQVAALETAYPQLRVSSSVDGWSDADLDEAVEAFHDVPCPALEDNGLCSLYAHRPLICRSMGIPERQDTMINGACGVQTFVAVTRLSASLEAEADDLAKREAIELAALPEVAAEGEEILLPYGFLTSSVDLDTQEAVDGVLEPGGRHRTRHISPLSDTERNHGTAYDSGCR
jgi:Fe-S-cluster containining protein